MTKEELKKHCEKQIDLCSKLNDYKHKDEHQTVLNLLKENKKQKEELIEAIGRADVLLEFMPKIKQLQQENQQLKDNWNTLWQYILEKDNRGYEKVYIEDILDKMQELEGDNSNE